MPSTASIAWAVAGAGALAALGYLVVDRSVANPRDLQALVQQYPQFQQEIQVFKDRDPSGKLKYLDWELRILASGAARSAEIADVVELFHRYSSNLPKRDIYQYPSQEFSALRDTLFAIQRKQERREKKRETRYVMTEACEAPIVYETDALIVRQIVNKAASVHYGLGAKWCISMKAQPYFEEYSTNNCIVFFVIRKYPIRGSRAALYNKLAIVYDRDPLNRVTNVRYWNTIDDEISPVLAREAYGFEFFGVEYFTYQHTVAQPKSMLAKLATQSATAEETRKVYEWVTTGSPHSMTKDIMFLVAASPTASPELLRHIDANAAAMGTAVAQWRVGRRRPSKTRMKDYANKFEKELRMTVMVNPNTPPEISRPLISWFRRRNIDPTTVQVVADDHSVRVRYKPLHVRKSKIKHRKRRRLRARRRRITPPRVIFRLPPLP